MFECKISWLIKKTGHWQNKTKKWEFSADGIHLSLSCHLYIKMTLSRFHLLDSEWMKYIKFSFYFVLYITIIRPSYPFFFVGEICVFITSMLLICQTMLFFLFFFQLQQKYGYCHKSFIILYYILNFGMLPLNNILY